MARTVASFKNVKPDGQTANKRELLFKFTNNLMKIGCKHGARGARGHTSNPKWRECLRRVVLQYSG